MSHMNNARSRLWLALLLSCSAALSGCGGGDGGGPPATCDSFTPCGGNLTGTWHLAKSCVSSAALMDAAMAAKPCAQGSATIDSYDASGTGTFDGQGAVKFDVAISLAFSLTFPNSCLGAGQTCTSVAQTLRARSGITSASCQMTGDGCSCSAAGKVTSRQENSVVISGTTFTETDSTDGSMQTSQYCVDGNTLRTQNDKDGEIDIWTR